MKGDKAGEFYILGSAKRRARSNTETYLRFSGSCCCIGINVVNFFVFSPTAESFGVSAKLGRGALWGSHPARFRGSKQGFQVKVEEGSKVPSKGFGRFRG